MKFSEYPYLRPDMKQAEKRIRQETGALRSSSCYAGCRQSLLVVSAQMQSLATARMLAQIRHTQNTCDPFYDREQNFFDEAMPAITPAYVAFYKAVIKSRFVTELSAEFGQRLIDIYKLAVARFNESLVPLMVRENKLATAYQKLLSSCDIELLGERRNLAGITKLLSDPDRTVRRRAFDAYASFFEANEEAFDALYDKLVHVRDEMGRKMGFDSFVPLAYMILGRTDYDASDVSAFRRQVIDALVPVTGRLRAAQAERIGVNSIRFYDESVLFLDGNAAPVGTESALIDKAMDMYAELSPETDAFFRFMKAHELLDLTSRPGKATGGYTESLPDYRAPFIFANFNGTSADVDVLTHEAGHAFQAYRSFMTQSVPEYREATYEVCEIHSMAMEFFTHPYMDRFFGNNADKYRFQHTTEALTFVPYGCLVDDFQHQVYENPDMTPQERKLLWRSLEKIYLPGRDYDGKSVFERGAFFYKQLHIFMCPFYYIDYTLSSMAAFELYGRMRQDRASAWKDYLRLCDVGGSVPYLTALKCAHLSSPFEAGSVSRAIAPLLDDVIQ